MRVESQYSGALSSAACSTCAVGVSIEALPFALFHLPFALCDEPVRSIRLPCVATRAGTHGPRRRQRALEGRGWQTASYRARGAALPLRECRAALEGVSGKHVHAPGGRKAGSLDQAADGPRAPTACATQASTPAAAQVSSVRHKVGLRTQSPIAGASLGEGSWRRARRCKVVSDGSGAHRVFGANLQASFSGCPHGMTGMRWSALCLRSLARR